MRLGNEQDIIIPGTTGLITAIRNEANQFNKNLISQEENNKYLANQIRSVGVVYNIIYGRASGINLNELVPLIRIANNRERTNNEKNVVENKERIGTTYESWFRE